MDRTEAKQLLQDYNEALDHLWHGNGQSVEDREKAFAEMQEKVLIPGQSLGVVTATSG